MPRIIAHYYFIIDVNAASHHLIVLCTVKMVRQTYINVSKVVTPAIGFYQFVETITLQPRTTLWLCWNGMATHTYMYIYFIIISVTDVVLRFTLYYAQYMYREPVLCIVDNIYRKKLSFR